MFVVELVPATELGKFARAGNATLNLERIPKHPLVAGVALDGFWNASVTADPRVNRLVNLRVLLLLFVDVREATLELSHRGLCVVGVVQHIVCDVGLSFCEAVVASRDDTRQAGIKDVPRVVIASPFDFFDWYSQFVNGAPIDALSMNV